MVSLKGEGEGRGTFCKRTFVENFLLLFRSLPRISFCPLFPLEPSREPPLSFFFFTLSSSSVPSPSPEYLKFLRNSGGRVPSRELPPIAEEVRAGGRHSGLRGSPSASTGRGSRVNYESSVAQNGLCPRAPPSATLRRVHRDKTKCPVSVSLQLLSVRVSVSLRETPPGPRGGRSAAALRRTQHDRYQLRSLSDAPSLFQWIPVPR